MDKLNRELYIIKESFSDQEGKSEYVDQNKAWKNKGLKNMKEGLSDKERLVERQYLKANN